MFVAFLEVEGEGVVGGVADVIGLEGVNEVGSVLGLDGVEVVDVFGVGFLGGELDKLVI